MKIFLGLIFYNDSRLFRHAAEGARQPLDREKPYGGKERL